MKAVCYALALLCLGGASAIGQTNGTGRACISLVTVANGDEDILRADSTGRRGLRIVAHVESTAGCDVVAAVFTKGGLPVAGCRPQFATLPGKTEITLPKAGGWNWEQDTGPIQGYVLFLGAGSKETAEIRSLVNAMQSSKDDAVMRLQAAKLRELIGKANMERSPRPAPKQETEVAGSYRMVVGFDWRAACVAVNFATNKPGAAVFPTIPR